MRRIKEKWLFVCLVLFISVALPSCGQLPQDGRTASSQSQTGQKAAEETVTLADIPAYTDQPYVEINQGEPEFTKEELTTEPYEDYGELDDLGRCQTVQALSLIHIFDRKSTKIPSVGRYYDDRKGICYRESGA